MTDPGAELALRAQPVLPMSPQQAREVMQAYSEMCQAVLGPDDVQRVGDRQFTKRAGFQKLAAAYGVSTEITSQTMGMEDREDEEGIKTRVLVARVVVRAVHPSGRHADGDGACASNEKRFRKGDEKMEHSLMATATTRAVNRAVSNLIAFGSVSAEEVEEGAMTGSAPPSLPEWALPMNDIAGVAENLTRVLKAAGVENTAEVVENIGNTVFRQADKSFPFIAARVVGLLAQAVDAEMAKKQPGQDIVDVQGAADATVEDFRGEDQTTTESNEETE